MVDERALLAEIAAHPGDPGPCNVYADWLEERGRADKAACLRAAVLQRAAIEQLRSVGSVGPGWLSKVLGDDAPRACVALYEHGLDGEDADWVTMNLVPVAGLDETLHGHLREVVRYFASGDPHIQQIQRHLSGEDEDGLDDLTDAIGRSMAYVVEAIGLPRCLADATFRASLQPPPDLAERYRWLRKRVADVALRGTQRGEIGDSRARTIERAMSLWPDPVLVVAFYSIEYVAFG